MGKGLEVWRVVETEPSRLDEISPAEITARPGTMTYQTGANICRLSGRYVSVEIKRVLSVVKCVVICRYKQSGLHSDVVYREGRHLPARRWGCAACPRAFSPSACCSHLARLYPDPHKHTCYLYRTVIIPISFRWIGYIYKIPERSSSRQKGKHTVIMMQGESFVQKSSSRSLWNVASFSTIKTNFAHDTISVHESRTTHIKPYSALPRQKENI